MFNNKTKRDIKQLKKDVDRLFDLIYALRKHLGVRFDIEYEYTKIKVIEEENDS